MTRPQIIVLATPVFLLLIALEFWVGLRRDRDTYRLNDALNSIGLGVMSQVTGLFGKLLRIGIYTAVFGVVALWQLPTDAVWVWVVGLVFYDFCYCWHHRFGHTVALFWAAHAVQRFDPPMSRAARVIAVVAFLLLLAGTTAFLCNAHRMTFAQQCAGAAALIAGLWLVGRLSGGDKRSVFSLDAGLHRMQRPAE